MNLSLSLPFQLWLPIFLVVGPAQRWTACACHGRATLPRWVDRLGCEYYSLHHLHDVEIVDCCNCSQNILLLVVAVEDARKGNRHIEAEDVEAAVEGLQHKNFPGSELQETPLVSCPDPSDVH